MKPGTRELIKFKKLKRRLGLLKDREVVGLLESLWLFAQKQCQRGDVGRFEDEDIAIAVEWDGDPSELLLTLCETGWLDKHPLHRYVIHDWKKNAPRWVTAAVSRSGSGWAEDDDTNGTQRDTVCTQRDTLGAQRVHKTDETVTDGTQCAHNVTHSAHNEAKNAHSLSLSLSLSPSLSKENTPLSPPRGADVPDDPPARSRRRRGPTNHQRTYSPAFLEIWGEWRPYESPRGDKGQAADVIESLTMDAQQQLRQAARAYCDECHRLRCKTKHLSTFARGDWREYLVENQQQETPIKYTMKFEHFWGTYPHQGIPEGKVETFGEWSRLSESDQDKVNRAVPNYARSKSVKDGFPKSAYNFLAKQIWRDYVELSEEQIHSATLDPSERERLERRRDYEREMAEHRRLGEQHRAAQAGMPPITPQLRRP
jgi:hypothetical protein